MHSHGKHHVTAALISRITGEGTCEKAARTIECDLLCMSVGYTPTSHLLHHLSAKFAYNKSTAMFEVASLPPHVFAAGSVAGTYNLDAVIQDGRRAGWLAARDAGLEDGERAGRAGVERQSRRHPSLADLQSPEGQGLRRFRRGPAGEGPGERRRRRLRRHRAAEALLHRRHGAVAGQAFRRHRRPHPRQGDRPRPRHAQRHHPAPALRAGKDRPARRPGLRSGAAHRHASPPPGTRRAHDARGRLVASGLLRPQGRPRAGNRATR